MEVPQMAKTIPVVYRDGVLVPHRLRYRLCSAWPRKRPLSRRHCRRDRMPPRWWGIQRIRPGLWWQSFHPGSPCSL